MSAKFVAFRTAEFPAAAGEDDELVNPGMYGRALCAFLEEGLKARGWPVGGFLNEDWGWWLWMDGPSRGVALCVYGYRHDADPRMYTYAITPANDSTWSWRRFRRVSLGDQLSRLTEDLERLLADRGVETFRTEDVPDDGRE